MTCIREHLTLETAGRRLEQNAERHLKPPAEMARLFPEHPEALAETQILLGRIGFSLDQLRYNYPTETIGNGETAPGDTGAADLGRGQTALPAGVPDEIKRSAWNELCLIAYKGYASYSLTVEDVVHYAREELKILCQGRGFGGQLGRLLLHLGVTEVDPTKVTLRVRPVPLDRARRAARYRRRFRARAARGGDAVCLPATHGGKRTGLTATVISYRSKSAVRETAKVFGISDDTIGALNQLHWGWGDDGRRRHQDDRPSTRTSPTLQRRCSMSSRC